MRLAKTENIERRRERVAALRLRNLSVREIAAALQQYGIVNPATGAAFSHTTIESDLKVLEARWRESSKIITEEHRARQLAEIAAVKRAAWASGDLELALKALDREIRLLGTIPQPGSPNAHSELFNRAVEALEAAGLDVEQTLLRLIVLANGRKNEPPTLSA